MGQSCCINARFFLFLSMAHMCFLGLAAVADTLLPNGSIKDGQLLVSANKRFRLRFFNPNPYDFEYNRYLGIWLEEPVMDFNGTVWVANRENSLYSTTGILTLTANGNLVVSYGRNGNVVWSTNVTAAQSNASTIAKLENNGNLVVREASTGAVLWESFDHPCDTLLPGMKIGINRRTGWSRMLTAWRSEDNPAPGIYAFGVGPQDLNQFFIWRRSIPYSRVIFWNGTSFNTFYSPNIAVDRAFLNASVVCGDDEVYLAISPSLGQRTWLVVGPSASLTLYSIGSNLTYPANIPVNLTGRIPCSSGGVCGPNASCNENEEPVCKCLPGYVPALPAEWNSGIWQHGCSGSNLQCGDKDEYSNLKKAELHQGGPHVYAYAFLNASMCRQKCYSRAPGAVCGCSAWAWTDGLDIGICQVYAEHRSKH